MLKALRLARANGARTALDIDYRPNLWGLAGHAAGEERFIASAAVTAKLQSTLHLFDLIVGTEEEFHIAGGSTDTIAALRAVREVSGATLVCKRGPMGAAAFSGADPVEPRRGRARPRLPDRGLQRARRRRRLHVRAAQGLADRPGLADVPEVRQRLRRLRRLAPRLHPGLSVLGGAAVLPRARHQDARAARRHRARAAALVHQPARRLAGDAGPRLRPPHAARTGRRRLGVARDRIGPFKELCLAAVHRVAAGRPGYGLLCDGRLGRDALYAAAGTGLWIGRPVEDPGTRPLRLEIEPDYGSALAEWPLEHVVKVLAFYHPDDDEAMKADQEATIVRLARAARANRLEFLLEIIPSKVGPVTDATSAEIIQRFYDLGVYPDWWKLEPMPIRRRLGERLRRHHPQRPAQPRHRGARAGGARRGAGRQLRRRRAPRPGQGLRRRPHASSPTPPAPGSAARSPTPRPSTTWPRIRAPLPHLGRGARAKGSRRMKTIRLTAAQATGALPEPPAQRGRRAVPRRLLGDLRPRQRRRHGRGAACRGRRLPHLARPQRAGHGARRHRLRQGAEPQARDGRDHLDRPRRAEHGHRRGAGPRQPAAGAAASRATSSPTAPPTRCCSRSRTSTTAR